MNLETRIGTLSRDEKLAAMDLIWQDLAADYKKIIADRLDNPNAGPALPLTESKAEIREAIEARRAPG